MRRRTFEQASGRLPQGVIDAEHEAAILEDQRRAADPHVCSWVYTYDRGLWQHCDDCKANHPGNPPLPIATDTAARLHRPGRIFL